MTMLTMTMTNYKTLEIWCSTILTEIFMTGPYLIAKKSYDEKLVGLVWTPSYLNLRFNSYVIVSAFAIIFFVNLPLAFQMACLCSMFTMTSPPLASRINSRKILAEFLVLVFIKYIIKNDNVYLHYLQNLRNLVLFHFNSNLYDGSLIAKKSNDLELMGLVWIPSSSLNLRFPM